MKTPSYENEFHMLEAEPVWETHFHMNGSARRLVLTPRPKATQKWPIHNSAQNYICFRFFLLNFPAVSNEDLREPANHDYKVLEGPEETGDEVDERARDSISRDPDRTSVDSDLSLEASKILNMEDNPAYAKPWKAKEDPELPLEASDFLNIENNPAYSKPWKAQENPEIPHEPLDFHNIENNPASSTPWRAKTAEPCLRRRANSL